MASQPILARPELIESAARASAVDAVDLPCTIERTAAEAELDHVRLRLQRAELEQLEELRQAVPRVGLELVLVVVIRIVRVQGGVGVYDGLKELKHEKGDTSSK